MCDMRLLPGSQCGSRRRFLGGPEQRHPSRFTPHLTSSLQPFDGSLPGADPPVPRGMGPKSTALGFLGHLFQGPAAEPQDPIPASAGPRGSGSGRRLALPFSSPYQRPALGACSSKMTKALSLVLSCGVAPAAQSCVLGICGATPLSPLARCCYAIATPSPWGHHETPVTPLSGPWLPSWPNDDAQGPGRSASCSQGRPCHGSSRPIG